MTGAVQELWSRPVCGVIVAGAFGFDTEARP